MDSHGNVADWKAMEHHLEDQGYLETLCERNPNPAAQLGRESTKMWDLCHPSPQADESHSAVKKWASYSPRGCDLEAFGGDWGDLKTLKFNSVGSKPEELVKRIFKTQCQY
ncbi:ras-related protein Rab-27B isoform X3 [Rattus norvegicus]|uniref:ras-related protein Rab-27B isoform X3 n=1 Tax=Rattus norvegicus TaxID=10116 RepID=UPI001916D628|nr:ras-related protein Rab-27B isoform X4 [Rattus norvegicus]